jgi:hypothetical protein
MPYQHHRRVWVVRPAALREDGLEEAETVHGPRPLAVGAQVAGAWSEAKAVAVVRGKPHGPVEQGGVAELTKERIPRERIGAEAVHTVEEERSLLLLLLLLLTSTGG